MKKRTPFLRKTRSAQKALYISTKNSIQRAAPSLGGLFYTDNYIHNEPVWLDIMFLGKKPLVYLAFFQTAKLAYLDELEDIALESSEGLLPREHRRDNMVELDNGHYRHISSYSIPHEEFGCISRMEWETEEIKRLADQGFVSVYEEVELIKSYSHGIGISVTLDVQYFTINNINEFILQFLIDEKGWKSKIPLSWTSSEMLPPRPYANAIVKPWEYETIANDDTTVEKG
jgi:hypothetical protein